MIPLQNIQALPVFYRISIPTDYLDVMGHMNVRWYMALFDSASWKFFETFGMDEYYYLNQQGGGFALKHFIQYLAEVRVGENVAIHGRVLGRTAKRVHFMLFMVNESTGTLAATLEALGSHANMQIRRTAPYPEAIATRIDAMLTEHNQLDWEAPVCGVIAP